jgi:hypothetical protein
MWEVKCYDQVDGKRIMVAWASGINTNMANRFCKEQRDIGRAEIHMKRIFNGRFSRQI